MLLNGGSINGARILEARDGRQMAQNHIGDLSVQLLTTQDPTLSNDAEFFPGMVKKWGLTWLINTEDVPGDAVPAVSRGRACSIRISGLTRKGT